MIRLGKKEDRNGLEALFDLCFPGEKSFTHWFFQKVWKPENTLLCGEEHIQAMLQLLPVQLRQGENRGQGLYVYGVGTHPSCRGKGLAGALLEEARKKGIEQGIDLLMLIPQETSLFDYYRRFGYRTAFWVEERQIKARREEEGLLSVAQPEDLPQVVELYRKALGSLFSVNRTLDDFAIQQELYGDKALVLRRDGRITAWGCIEPVGEAWRVCEALGPDALRLAAAALDWVGAEEGLCRLLPQNDPRPFAMALPLTPVGEKLLEQKAGYCNLLFN